MPSDPQRPGDIDGAIPPLLAIGGDDSKEVTQEPASRIDLSFGGLDSRRSTWKSSVASPIAFDDVATGAFGRYRNLHELGRGGMGRVYLAEDPILERRVALKVVLAEMAGVDGVERFFREARLLARLDHPHIVSIHDVGVADGRPYFTMDHVDGEPLDQWMASTGTDARLSMMAVVARAVEHAHDRGIIHRDLKPSNILVDRSGQPRILDFGLARPAVADGARISRSGALIGTTSYMSPEQAAGQIEAIDRRTDVWGLGILLLESVTGRRAFQGTDLEVLSRIVKSGAPMAREIGIDLPRDLEIIISRATERRQGDRYPTAGALAEDLERFVAGDTIRARPHPLPVRIGRWARRRRALLLAGLAVCSAITVSWASIRWIEGDRRRTGEEVLADRRARDLAARRESLPDRLERIEARLAATREHPADPIHLESLGRDLDALESTIGEIEAATGVGIGPPLSPDRLGRLRRDLHFEWARSVVGRGQADRMEEARRLLESLSTSGTPIQREAARPLLARIESTLLPPDLRGWPGARPDETDLDRPTVEAGQRSLERLESLGPTTAVDRARLLLWLDRPAAARALLLPMRSGLAARGVESAAAVLDIYRGLILACARSRPPDLEGVERHYLAASAWVEERLADGVDPEPLVPLAVDASQPTWDRWMEFDDPRDIARIQAWLEGVWRKTTSSSWTDDLPWMLGVALVVDGESRRAVAASDDDLAEARSLVDRGADCLRVALELGHRPQDGPNYARHPELGRLRTFVRGLEEGRKERGR